MTLGVLLVIATAIALKRLPAPRPHEWQIVWIVLEDDLSTRANFRHVFGGQLPEAAALLFDDVSLWIEPPPPEIDIAAKPAAPGRIVTFRLVAGRVELARPPLVANELRRFKRLTPAGPSP